jgi:hypothetical protein
MSGPDQSHSPGSARRVLPLLLALAAASLGCHHSSSPPAPDAGDAGPIPCLAYLDGLTQVDDGGLSLTLSDAGFDCVALLYGDDAGTRTSFSLTPPLGGTLPPGVLSFSAVLVLDGGHPPQHDAGSDAGPVTLDDPLVLQASASITLDTRQAFALDKDPASPPTTGTAALQLTQVSDGGPLVGDHRVLTGHGTFDATLPYLFGPPPVIVFDAGPVPSVDGGSTVNVHVTF